MRRLPALLIATGCLLGPAVHAQDYTYTRLYGGVSFDQIEAPVINNAGQVAFAARSAGGSGVFTGDGTTYATVADTADGYFRALFAPSLNNAGQVAFAAFVSPNSLGVFTGTAGALTNIALSDQGYNAFEVGTSINDSGQVAFAAGRPETGRGVFLYDGQTTGALYTGSTPDESLRGAALNNRGTVAAVRQRQSDNSAQVVTGDGGPLTELTPRVAGSGDGSLNAAINNAGTVAFAGAGRHGENSYLGVGNGPGQLSTFSASELGLFRVSPNVPSLNNAGRVAFGAIQNGSGIFVGEAGASLAESLRPVIRTGDRLFGSLVNSVSLSAFGGAMNDQGQIVFVALLSGRTPVLVRADPVNVIPEPGTWALIAAGLLPLAMAYWGRAHANKRT